jgi:hypothetical protein
VRRSVSAGHLPLSSVRPGSIATPSYRFARAIGSGLRLRKGGIGSRSGAAGRRLIASSCGFAVGGLAGRGRAVVLFRAGSALLLAVGFRFGGGAIFLSGSGTARYRGTSGAVIGAPGYCRGVGRGCVFAGGNTGAAIVLETTSRRMPGCMGVLGASATAAHAAGEGASPLTPPVQDSRLV